MSFTDLVKNNYVKQLQAKALPIIKADRDKFQQVWSIIDTYIAEVNNTKDKIIISDKYKLIGEDDSIKAIFEKSYRLYTGDPFRHANKITNLLHEQTKNKYIKLKTVYEHEELAIEYDLRIVCIIYKIQKNAAEILKPEIIDKLLYLPPEIEMIDVYKDLYTMTNDSSGFEVALFDKIAQRKESGIIGSGNCKERRKEFLEAIKISLLKDLESPLRTKDNKFVLLGPWARDWQLHGDNICAGVEKIQIVGIVKPEELRSLLQAYISSIQTATITYREQELYIPKDFRTTRYTYYMKFKDERGYTEKPFLDLFNSADFELVPYFINNGIAIAHKLFVLRFLFIDLWIVRRIKDMGLLNAETVTKKIDHLWNNILYFRALEYKEEPLFIGTYKDFNVDKKLNTLGVKIPYPYYPEIYFDSNKKYRDI